MALTDPINTLIRRLRLSVGSDGLTVTMGSGSCYLPNTRRLISDGSSSVTLVNPTVSTWYFAYAYEASPGIAGLELSPVAPDVPYGSTARTKTGDSTRRYIGSVYVQSTGLIRPFRMLNSETLGRKVLFSASSAAGSVPIPALLNFTNSTATNISLNPLIPATATHAVLDVKNASNRTAYFSNPDNGQPARRTGFYAPCRMSRSWEISN